MKSEDRSFLNKSQTTSTLSTSQQVRNSELKTTASKSRLDTRITSYLVDKQTSIFNSKKTSPKAKDSGRGDIFQARPQMYKRRPHRDEVSPAFKSQVKFDDFTKERPPSNRSQRRQSPYSRRDDINGLIHEYQMKNTPTVSNKINQQAPIKVMEFMKENNYHPYYVTNEHYEFWRQQKERNT